MKSKKIKMFRFIENNGDHTTGGAKINEVEEFLNSGIEIINIFQSESAFYNKAENKKQAFFGWNLTITIVYK